MSENVGKDAIRKVRKYLLPYMFFLYILNFVDRVNVGFAALKMNKDLGMSAEQFGLAAGIFFIGYLIFQVPSNLILNKIGARIWIGVVLALWGLISTLTGFVKTPDQLYLARFLLGLVEAGFFPGVILYLTFWFPQRELAQAVALFMTALAISSVIGSPVSGIILDHVNWGGLESWRWLFILEGLPAVLFGVITYIVLPNKPKEAKFLNEEEKNWLTNQISVEQEAKAKQEKISIGEAMKNGKTWLLAFIYFFGPVAGLFAASFWMPTIIKSLSKGYSAETVGFLAMIPWLFAAIMMVIVGKSADKKAEWRYHSQIPVLIGAIAVFMLLFVKSPFISIVLLSFITAGALSAFGPFWALPNKFLTGAAAAAGIALINAVGNLGGFAAPYIIGFIKTATGSMHYGIMALGIMMLIDVALLAILPKRITRGDI
jgi:D-galactonate transporter